MEPPLDRRASEGYLENAQKFRYHTVVSSTLALHAPLRARHTLPLVLQLASNPGDGIKTSLQSS